MQASDGIFTFRSSFEVDAISDKIPVAFTKYLYQVLNSM